MDRKSVVGAIGLFWASVLMSGCICLTWEPHWGRGSDDKSSAQTSGPKHAAACKYCGDQCPHCGRLLTSDVDTARLPSSPAGERGVSAPGAPDRGIQQTGYQLPPSGSAAGEAPRP